MKRILVPISFSRASKNSLRHAVSVFSKATTTLLHIYPSKDYNKKYKFSKNEYDAGIREKLWEFYLRHVENPDKTIPLLTEPGSISQVVGRISNRYDLMVMSRKAHPTKKQGYFSDKKLFITTMARCPVLIMPFTDTSFDFKNCEHIWHIKRQETETKIVRKSIKKIGINPTKLEVKSLEQSSFLSAFWENLVAYEKSHDKKLIKKIDKAHDKEPIDLIVLVDNDISVFTSFFKSDLIHIFCKYDIPILVLPGE